MLENHNTEAIEMLSRLEPIRRSPGMYSIYTQSLRSNQLAQEVSNNRIDEAIAGFASNIIVTLHEDNSIEVEDMGKTQFAHQTSSPRRA